MEFVENGISEMEDETNTSVVKKRKRKEKGTVSGKFPFVCIFELLVYFFVPSIKWLLKFAALALCSNSWHWF